MATPLTFFTGSPYAGKRDADIAGRVLSWTLAIVLPVAVVALALIVTTVRVPEADTLPPVANAAGTQAPAAGRFTGEYADGVPVYRLPSVSVVGRRDPALPSSPDRRPAGLATRTTDTRAN